MEILPYEGSNILRVGVWDRSMVIMLTRERVSRPRRFIRLKLILRRVTHSRGFYVIVIFLTMFLISSAMFYYVEHEIHGRNEVDLPTAMYWALVTMATVGYGDVVVTHDVLGYTVAGMTAVMGIATYTLVISTLADAFFSGTLQRALGRGKMKKKILIIGTTPSCREAIDELVLSGYGDMVGWVMSREPKAPPPVDFIVGEYSEETLVRAGVMHAETILICLRDDSTILHLVLLIKRLNKKARIMVLVNDPRTAELLRELGVKDILTQSLLGRIAATAIFEPTIVRFVNEVVTVRGGVDLTEVIVTEEGITVGDLEKELMKLHKDYRFEIIAVRRGDELIYAPQNDMKLSAGDRLVILRAKT